MAYCSYFVPSMLYNIIIIPHCISHSLKSTIPFFCRIPGHTTYPTKPYQISPTIHTLPRHTPYNTMLWYTMACYVVLYHTMIYWGEMQTTVNIIDNSVTAVGPITTEHRSHYCISIDQFCLVVNWPCFCDNHDALLCDNSAVCHVIIWITIVCNNPAVIPCDNWAVLMPSNPAVLP